jgi:hypothetical protein
MRIRPTWAQCRGCACTVPACSRRALHFPPNIACILLCMETGAPVILIFVLCNGRERTASFVRPLLQGMATSVCAHNVHLLNVNAADSGFRAVQCVTRHQGARRACEGNPNMGYIGAFRKVRGESFGCCFANNRLKHKHKSHFDSLLAMLQSRDNFAGVFAGSIF